MAKKIKNEIVELDEKNKTLWVSGNIADPQFQALIALNKPEGYMVKIVEDKPSIKQQKVRNDAKEHNGEWFKENLTEEELAIFNAIKKATVIGRSGKPVTAGFYYAKKWFDDGKQMEGNNPKFNKYKGTGKNKEVVGTFVVEI